MKGAVRISVGVLALAFLGGAGQQLTIARAARLDGIKAVVEERFKQLERTSTTRLAFVRTNKSAQGEMLQVGIAPANPQRLEFHAETALALIWQALSDRRVPTAFREFARIQLSVGHSDLQLAITCPTQVVREGMGYYEMTKLQRECQVYRPVPFRGRRNES